jgi:hypothetical protein
MEIKQDWTFKNLQDWFGDRGEIVEEKDFKKWAVYKIDVSPLYKSAHGSNPRLWLFWIPKKNPSNCWLENEFPHIPGIVCALPLQSMYIEGAYIEESKETILK